MFDDSILGSTSFDFLYTSAVNLTTVHNSLMLLKNLKLHSFEVKYNNKLMQMLFKLLYNVKSNKIKQKDTFIKDAQFIVKSAKIYLPHKENKKSIQIEQLFYIMNRHITKNKYIKST